MALGRIPELVDVGNRRLAFSVHEPDWPLAQTSPQVTVFARSPGLSGTLVALAFVAGNTRSIVAVLAQLSPKARQAIQFVKFDGLSVSEATARSGVSESAIKVSVHRRLRALPLLSKELLMNTDDLVKLLATDVEPVTGREPSNRIAIALTGGAVAAFCLMLSIFGVPTDTLHWETFAPRSLALAFALGLAAAGATFLIRSSRPGEPRRGPLLLAGLLFAAVFSAGTIAFIVADPAARTGMLLGPQWVACLIYIPLFAVAPFVSLIWALRKGAPTNLVRTGATAGLVAGALGAAVCAFHHPGDSTLFIALWYGGPILLCAFAGALLGPRLLRW